ncbi:hypothetical protein IYX23_02945 [Methylocystis sp. L43]|uniref:hypothetical protein n=1 Tax=unclassified Methylocystis TaxID=2625913 RepID=UPI0018C2C2A0|nr:MULTISPECIES: hypothetical protein [unclassified Methylocystis]MBG0796654.1 hypothetical protein [Methylocystis sp. L43]MBG0804627.1 hypothetical protein [Methylocystis sp. H15]
MKRTALALTLSVAFLSEAFGGVDASQPPPVPDDYKDEFPEFETQMLCRADLNHTNFHTSVAAMNYCLDQVDSRRSSARFLWNSVSRQARYIAYMSSVQAYNHGKIYKYQVYDWLYYRLGEADSLVKAWESTQKAPRRRLRKTGPKVTGSKGETGSIAQLFLRPAPPPRKPLGRLEASKPQMSWARSGLVGIFLRPDPQKRQPQRHENRCATAPSAFRRRHRTPAIPGFPQSLGVPREG